MHEASAAEALVKLICNKIANLENKKVTKIKLIAGTNTGYMKESLVFYFKAHAKGSPLEKTEIDIEYKKSIMHCENCNLDFERSLFSFDCPICKKSAKMKDPGLGLFVDYIEVEE